MKEFVDIIVVVDIAIASNLKPKGESLGWAISPIANCKRCGDNVGGCRACEVEVVGEGVVGLCGLGVGWLLDHHCHDPNLQFRQHI